MAKFDDYSRSYRFIKMERRGGILQMTLHTDGGPLQWNLDAQVEFVRAFTDVGTDRENRIVILTGSGNEFSGPRLDPDTPFFHGAKLTPGGVHEVFVNARKMVNAVLGIEVPMIAAVNGPAKRHADLALMCDIVIAADDVTFEDTAHFHNGGIVPGDGINVVYTMLMGLNRARYLMLTGQVLNAREAKDIGLVAELMPREKLLPRAWQLAEQLAKKNDMLLRYTRMVLTHPLRKQLDEGLQYFLAMEALSTLDKSQQQ
ncbi:MAG TPA: enoyl-CoA hydratase/isomerase family protein [Burkholderiales bacterium]|nr:enoyl-CoA hydratase/isomerase family protein [Burkholderiales bacterium]